MGSSFAFLLVWLARHTRLTPPVLPILILMVTDKCNLKCKMCGACDYTPGDHGMLTLAQWKAVIDAAERLKTQVVSITGGEALLRKDLFDLIAYARTKSMTVHLNTNGLLLRDRNVASLAASGVESVSISVESTNPTVHDAIRGKGTLKHTIEGIRRLRRACPDTRIGLNTVLNRHNLDSMPNLVRFAERENLDQVKFAPIHSNLQHKDKPLDEYADMVFGPQDTDSLTAGVDAIRQALATTRLESCSDRFFEGIPNLYRQPASNFYCYAGYAVCVVNPQGDVSACFDKAPCANVKDRPLDQIWRSPAFQRHRAVVRNCDQACWDTTNAELSLRLSFRNLLKEPRKTYRTVRYYLLRHRPQAPVQAQAQD
jgi:MoaA/NifB/PqqE/SkfB family radical SAM enzyme